MPDAFGGRGPSQNDAAEWVVLVDEDDRELGVAPKLPAHRQGLRHRAFSVIVRDAAGRHLLQRRALSKYHSPGLWSNACCGHPRQNEGTEDAARRRLHEELGFACDLRFLGRLAYAVRFDDGLAENEVVSLFMGLHEGSVSPDPQEVEEVGWASLPELLPDIRARPEAYTYWFRLYMLDHLKLLDSRPNN